MYHNRATRISRLFERCANENRKAFIAYMTAGDPTRRGDTPALVPRWSAAERI